MDINKRIIILFVAAALVGGVSGSLTRSIPAQANILENLYNQYFRPLIQPPVSSPGITSSTNLITPEIKSQLKETKEPYSPTIDYEQAVVKAVESASPAVISIIISKDLQVIEQCPYNPFSDLSPDIQQLFGQQFEFSQPCQKGTKKQEVGGGSGFIISSDGLIVTNKHVIFDEKAEYTVLTNEGKKYNAKVLARDPNKDLAVIKISASNLPVVHLGDSSSLKLGQTAIAIGNALGEFRNTVSVGVISGLARSIVASGGGLSEKIEGLIQTDAAINQGNSGGPLLNLKGEVVGINVAMVSGAQNIGFAVPINQVKKAIESVEKVGRIITPYLGVRYLIITAESAKKEKLPVENGALVRGSSDGPAVMPNSPAEKSGVRAEDIILKMSGTRIDGDHTLAGLVAQYNVGDTVTLPVRRNGTELTLEVVLAKRPE